MATLETLHERANNAFIENDTEKAIELYKEIISISPQDEIAYSQLMDLYFDTDKLNYYITRANLNILQNKLEHAINDCKKAINVDATVVLPHIKLARLYVTTKKNLKAVDEFNKVLEIEPNEMTVYSDLIQVYLDEDSPESAIATARKAIEVFPSNKDFKNILAKLYFDSGDYKNALEVVQDSLLKAKILLQDEKNNDAKEILDSVKLSDINKEQKALYYSLLAQYYYNNKEYDNALETIKDYVKIAGVNPVSYQMKALIYEAKGDKFSSLINWGYCSKVRGRVEEAIMHFQGAIEVNPKDKDALIELAKLYEATNEKYISMEYWQKVYEVDSDIQAQKILAEFYYNEGDLKLAQKYGKVIPQKELKQKEYNQSVEEDEGFLEKVIRFFSKGK